MSKVKNSGLGRGLDAIFLNNEVENDGSDSIRSLRITQIEPRPGQPRKNFDSEALAQLAESIANHGLIQPIAVRLSESGFYSIIAGERRWRAAKMAGLTELPVIVMDVDEKKASEIALIENLQREDLNPIEEAEAYKTLINEYNLTQEEISKSIGKSRSAVANAVRLLDLPEAALNMVLEGKLSAGHARSLLGLNDIKLIDEAAEIIYNKGLSVREAEVLVRSMNRSVEDDTDDETALPAVNVDYRLELERKLTLFMGRKIKITDGKRSHKLEIEYADNDDLNTIIEKLFGDKILEE